MKSFTTGVVLNTTYPNFYPLLIQTLTPGLTQTKTSNICFTDTIILFCLGLHLSDIVHTKLSADKRVMERLQNRDWQYLVKSLIYKAEKDRDYYKMKTVEDSEMITDMEHNYRILRRTHNEIYTLIAEKFQLYINSLDQAEPEEIDVDFVSIGLNSVQNVDTATELMMFFDFFYFVNDRFPTATAHTFIPMADLPLEVNGEEINIKKL